MSEKDLLFEIKPEYNIGYTIISHFGDIVVFIIIMAIIRTTTYIITKCNYCSGYIFNRSKYWANCKKTV